MAKAHNEIQIRFILFNTTNITFSIVCHPLDVQLNNNEQRTELPEQTDKRKHIESPRRNV